MSRVTAGPAGRGIGLSLGFADPQVASVGATEQEGVGSGQQFERFGVAGPRDPEVRWLGVAIRVAPNQPLATRDQPHATSPRNASYMITAPTGFRVEGIT